MRMSATSSAIALALLVVAAHGAAAQTSTDPGSNPTAVTPTPSTGKDSSVTGGDTPSKPEQTTDSPSASPKAPSPGRDDSDASVAPNKEGTGTFGPETYGSPPYGLGSTPTGK